MARRASSSQNGAMFMKNAIDTLIANIRFAGAEEPVDTIAITSSIPNEGKSTIAVNLARTLADNGESVLLVECDVHRRSLSRILGVRARTGMYSVLLERTTIEQALVSTRYKDLTLLDCEPSIPNPANVFASVQFRNLVKRLRSMFDYVVLDTPPLSAYVDGAVVGAVADAVLLVTRWEYVRRDDVRIALEQLHKAEANVIGTVVNCLPVMRDSYYYGERGRQSDYPESADVPRVVGSSGGAPTDASAYGQARGGAAAHGLNQ